MNKSRIYYSLIPIYTLIVCLILTSAQLTDTAILYVNKANTTVSNPVIVIDAGHGGEDGGALSCTEIPESRYNLQISQKLNYLIMLLGVKTKMIRTGDYSVYTEGSNLSTKKVSDIRNRVKFANSSRNNILVSIHQNYFHKAKYRGAQVFYSPSQQSREIADCVQRQLMATVNPGNRRTIAEAKNIYLMEHIKIPGILIECGFISNPEEEALLRNPEYQKKICCVISTALLSYINATY